MAEKFFLPIFDWLADKGLLSPEGTYWDWFVVTVLLPLYLASPLFAAAWLLPQP